MTSDADILAQIDAAFADVGKPEHFTDYRHCCECAEHDETLLSHDRDSLELRHVGNPGWDPLCFSSAQGLAYYLPTLVHFAPRPAEPRARLVWRSAAVSSFSCGGAWNRLCCHCSPEQRGAIAALLAHLVETRAAEVDGHPGEDVLLQACALWSTPA
ncbi:hypothetical protein ACE0DR_02665 [Azotobacter sp. CWF10]